MRFTATPHRYVRRSAAQWQALLEAYERSGLSQRTFCQQQGLALSSFVRWRRQLAGRINISRMHTIPGSAASTKTPMVCCGILAEESRFQKGWN